MLLSIFPENPQKRIVNRVADGMKKGGVFIIPTDTVYAFATTLGNKKAIEYLYQLKEIPPKKPLSLYAKDFSQVSEFIRMDNNQVFSWMKSNLPGPYTLIFPASKKLPQYTLSKQKTVGIRIIDHPFVQMLLDQLDMPVIGSSVFNEERYLTWPEDLEDFYGKRVEAIIDAGPINLEVSTILEASNFPFEVIREGKGEINF